MQYKVKTIYAYIAEDESGNEGICAMKNKDGHKIPLFGTSLDSMNALKPYAKKIALGTNKGVRLVEFTLKEDIETTLP
jgi:hypothetical protein